MGREQDFLVGDFVLVRIIFLLLVIFREQLLAALVGSGGNSGFVFTPLDDCDFTMRAWQVCALLSPGLGKRKSRIPFQISCLDVPLIGGGLFSFLIGYQFVKPGIYLFSIINSLHFHSSPRTQYVSVLSRTVSLKPTAL